MAYSEFIESERGWLDRNAEAYREAIGNLSSPDYVRGLLHGIEEMLGPALAYNPVEHLPHVAVHAIGIVQSRLSDVLTELAFIDQYEDRRSELERIINSESQPERTTGVGDRFGYGNEQ